MPIDYRPKINWKNYNFAKKVVSLIILRSSNLSSHGKDLPSAPEM